MPSARMWWGRSQRSRDIWDQMDAEWSGKNVVIRGRVGYDVVGPVAVAFYGNWHQSWWVRGQYYMSRERMPEGGCDFISRPSVILSGSLRGQTRRRRIFDSPSATCDMVLRQSAYTGDGVKFAQTNRSIRLIDIKNDARETDYASTGSFDFDSFVFDLDRSQSLRIDLLVKLKFFHEGGNFYFGGDGPDFLIEMPQWDITSV